ncbi:MAG: efflux RND transporter permease subunit [Actinomycetia bacterium]|nr:efflux RND transporter permease subunit [Actinomycetes bacterium]
MENNRTYRTYGWIGSHIRWIAVAMLLVAIGLGVAGPMIANTDEPNFDPDGEIFTSLEDVNATLGSDATVRTATWLVESNDQEANVLDQATLSEWYVASEGVRTDAVHSGILVDRYDADTGVMTPGLMSIADVVDSVLPAGIEAASESEVRSAVTQILARNSSLADFRHTLSESAEPTVEGWVSPAFTAQLVYDSAHFEDIAAEERWLREVQADLREGAVHTNSIGVAIDGDTTFGEAATQSAPFIFLAVALIILLVAFVHRSYWSAVVVGAGLASTALAYYGTAALLGLKMGSLLLSFIVPIAMISFGVDFYIHGVGRVREMQIERDLGVKKAYPFGMSAVFTAMLLAVSSSVAAFMANAASGTESIIQFGIGAAISLVWAYLILGQIGPRVTVGLEEFVGDDPIKGVSRIAYALGAVLMAVVGGLAVALSAVMPTIGAAALVFFTLVLVALPAVLSRRRNRRAAARGAELVQGHTGVAHGLKPVGETVHFLAKWRIVTIPVVLFISAVAFMQATSVESGFEIDDFLSTETDFAQSIERVSSHFPSIGEGSSLIFVEGDLTDPSNLAAIDRAVDRIATSEAGFGRNGEGDLIVGLHAADLVRMTMASPAIAEIEASGPKLTDANGDRIPDTSAGVAAIYRHIATNGVQTPTGELAITASDVADVFVDGGAEQATAIVIQVGSFTDADVIKPVEDTLNAVATQLTTETDDLSARVTGDVLAQFHSMNSFTRSMLVSLPLALLLALIISSVMLRSIRYAFVSVLPIGLVVLGIYAFMATFGYTVNVVTATIAAIAVGVGIDFSTHFTARFREELDATGTALEAVRRSGTGTGGALVLSAVTSVLGFLVMAFAPTPIFATFGALTAVMIVLSLMVALLVLPSLLVLATPSRTEAEDTSPAAAKELLPV